MRRSAWSVGLVCLLGGCVSTNGSPETGGGPMVNYGKRPAPMSVPGVKGPHGEGIPMVAPYSYAPPPNAWTAQQMMARNIPLNMVQFNQGGPNHGLGGAPAPFMPPGGVLSPPGVPFMPGAPGGMPGPGGPGGGMPFMPPGPGGMPGVNPASFAPGAAAGDGVINAHIAPGKMPAGNVMLAQAGAPGAPDFAAAGMRFPTTRSQVLFSKPSGMKVFWYTRGADGKDAYSATPIETPGRYNFAPGVYRLKLSNLPGRPGVDLYPTLEVVPCNAKTEAFLAHNAVPLNFTEYDFKQVADGNYLVKVIYLPDPQFQDVAGTGTGEILNNPLEPGMDPIQEALRRGSILLVIRMGNVDQEAPNTPPLTTPMPRPGALPPGMPPGAMQGMMPPGMMPDPRTGPLLQMPVYGKPPIDPRFLPPSGEPRPGVTPLPPTIGVPDHRAPLTPPPGLVPPGLIPPPVGKDKDGKGKDSTEKIDLSLPGPTPPAMEVKTPTAPADTKAGAPIKLPATPIAVPPLPDLTPPAAAPETGKAPLTPPGAAKGTALPPLPAPTAPAPLTPPALDLELPLPPLPPMSPDAGKR